MKLDVVARAMAASAAALLIAGCGGGSGGGGGESASTLEVSGTAAVGAALADATVRVKCAAGDEGTATTSSAGGYTVTVSGGALPCIIKVSGATSNGAAVTLHSVAESGSNAADKTTAKANVTPVTELIVAQLLAALPSEAFANFNPQQVTQTALADAATAIVGALKAAGVDLGSIDPLTAELVPATPSASGNAYDQLLDKLGGQIGPESLPLVVNQVATSAASNSSEGLTDALAAVSGGALEGCPSALSGKYRVIDYNGALQNITVDFKAMTLAVEGESGTETLTRSSTQACEVKVADSTIVFGPGGVGAIHAADVTGYVIPVQSHTLASITGTWTFMESGLDEENHVTHYMGQFSIAADGTSSVCEYDLSNFSVCTAAGKESVQAQPDGGFKIVNDLGNTRFYAFRAAGGEMTIFGTNNPGNSWNLGDYKTHWVMTKAAKLQVPAVGHVQKFWQLLIGFNGIDLVSQPLLANSSVVKESDASAGTYTRTQASNNQTDSWRVNYPVDGMRYRAGSEGISEMHQLALPSLGMSTFLVGSTRKNHGMLVTRP